jgi:hypothetical protein
MGSKLKELDRLYKENEVLREELTSLSNRFDFDEVEEKLALSKEKDEHMVDLF